MKQAIKLFALLARHPVLFVRASLRLIFRGLQYLSENPDLAWARELLPPAGSAANLSLLVLIAKKGRPLFSLMIANGKIKTLPAQILDAFDGLESFQKRIEADLNLPLQAVLIQAEIFEQINSKLAAEPGLDAFFIAGREILSALSHRQTIFSPILPDAEMLASLDGEELLSKFGPRFGLSLQNSVSFFAVLRGLGLAVISPLIRRRIKKQFRPHPVDHISPLSRIRRNRDDQ